METSDLEWVLPSIPREIMLTQGELLLLDWCLCAASRILPNTDLDYLVDSWHAFRLDIWRGIGLAVANKNGTAKIEMDESLAKVLLAILPTTFRWGTGVDVGYTLKTKLATHLDRDILGVPPTSDPPVNQSGCD